MTELLVQLTIEQVNLIRAITTARIEVDPDNKYGDWAHDLDRRLKKALND